jgi:glycogen(starch) synthase
MELPQRILMTADAVGGVWTYALELSRALAPAGTEVLLATMGARPSDVQRRQAAAVDNMRLVESDYLLEWMNDPWDDVARAGDWLLRLAREFRPDVVHLNGYAHAALPWDAPTVVVGHSCVCSWWEAVKGEPAPAEWDRYREVVSRGLHATDLVVAPSRAMRAALRRHYAPIPWAMVVYNARHKNAFQPAEKQPFVLSAGRFWDEAKNLAALDQAAVGLPWPVYVAGDTEAPNGDTAARTGAARPLGKLAEAELAGWLGRAAIYALPAKYEPFGLSALEAALSGCALVLGDIDSLREIWEDTAAYVPPGDADAMSRTLVALIESPARRQQLAARAVARARRYSPQFMLAGYLAAYREAIAARGGAPSEALKAAAAPDASLGWPSTIRMSGSNRALQQERKLA